MLLDRQGRLVLASMVDARRLLTIHHPVELVLAIYLGQICAWCEMLHSS